jgi:hypothetical protein
MKFGRTIEADSLESRIPCVMKYGIHQFSAGKPLPSGMGMNGRPEMLKEINIPGKPDRFGYNRAMAKGTPPGATVAGQELAVRHFAKPGSNRPAWGLSNRA